MLRKGTNFLFIIFILNSCDVTETKHEVKLDIPVKANSYVKTNFNSYKEVFQTINDSLNLYLDSLLKESLFIYGEEWEVDSFICINSSNDNLVSVISSSSGIGKQAVSDAISGLLGKKINNQWYFFTGLGTLIVPRDMYGKDSLHPLTFHELSQIARKEMLEGSLIKNDKGEYVINDEWINSHFYNAGFDNFTHHKVYGMVSPGEEYQMPRDKEKTDSVHWHLIMDKWKHKIDTNEYKPRHTTKKEVLP